MAEFARMCRKQQGSLSRSEARTAAQRLVARHWPRIDRLTLRLARHRRLGRITT
jgi:hypothetical protein